MDQSVPEAVTKCLLKETERGTYQYSGDEYYGPGGSVQKRGSLNFVKWGKESTKMGKTEV